MLLPSSRFWETALCSPPQRVLNDFARRHVHWRVPNLLASDQTTVGSLPHRLAYEVPFDRASLDHVKNRPQRASKLEALSRLYVALGQISMVKCENARDFAGAPEIRRNCHVKLRWIQIRQIVQAKRRVVTEYTLNFFVPVPGPQCPTDKVRPVSRRTES